MNESNEEKQWLAKRIDAIHEYQLKEIENNGRRFEKVGDSEIARLKGRRNNFFSVLGIALTVLFALNTSSDFKYEYLVWGIGIISILGITNFAVFAYYLRVTENMFVLVSNQFLEFELIVNMSYGYTVSRSSVLSAVDFEHLSQYLIFTTILISAVDAKLKDFLKNMKENYNMRPAMKEVFQMEEVVENIKENTDLLIKEVTIDEIIPKRITMFIRDALKIPEFGNKEKSKPKST
jgi:hypothetical protein